MKPTVSSCYRESKVIHRNFYHHLAHLFPKTILTRIRKHATKCLVNGLKSWNLLQIYFGRVSSSTHLKCLHHIKSKITLLSGVKFNSYGTNIKCFLNVFYIKYIFLHCIFENIFHIHLVTSSKIPNTWLCFL